MFIRGEARTWRGTFQGGMKPQSIRSRAFVWGNRIVPTLTLPQTKPKKKDPMNLHRKSSIETLESRIAPAGVVTAGYDAITKILTLTGDGVDNDASVFKTGPGTYRVVGNATTTIVGHAPV